MPVYGQFTDSSNFKRAAMADQATGAPPGGLAERATSRVSNVCHGCKGKSVKLSCSQGAMAH
eukprot:552509-Amphidinium_carterae.1